MRMLAGIFAEMFPVRPYPLDMTVWLPALSAAAVEPLFSLVGVSAPPITAMITQEDGVPVRFSGQLRVRPTLALLLAPLRVLWLAIRYDPIRYHADRRRIDARRRARALAAREVEALSWRDLLALVRETLALPLPLAGEPRRRYYPRALLAAGLLRIVLGILGRGRSFGTLLSTGIESETVKSNREIAALAERVRSSPSLAALFAEHEAAELQPLLVETEDGRAFQAEFDGFTERYGHRETVLSTALEPTWQDAPAVVLGMVKGMAMVAAPAHEQRPAWEAARNGALAHPLLRPAFARSAFNALVATARCLWVIREDSHFDATLILPGLRRILLELGRRLVDVGVLEAPEDIFHLRFEELVRAGRSWPPAAGLMDELRTAARRRKARRAELENVPFVDPRLFRQAGSKPGEEGEIVLRGAPGSPGVAEGPVRIITGASEFGMLRAGEVLVAPYTNPAWTPLFQRAAAVVVDAGGTGSHAAIVAREYGIPAVMGTADGTRQLANGEQVRVDGTRGLVFRSRGADEAQA